MMARAAALAAALLSVAAHALQLPVPRRRPSTTARRAVGDETVGEPLDVVILQRSRSALTAVGYELAASLAAQGCGVGVACDRDDADAESLRALAGVEVATPKDGIGGYDDAVAKLFGRLGSDKPRAVCDLATRDGDGMGKRLAAATDAAAVRYALVTDWSSQDAAAEPGAAVGNDVPLGDAEVVLAASSFEAGSVAVRAQAVLGATACAESFRYGTHPLSYFFDRVARDVAIPLPGPGPRGGLPPQLLSVCRAEDAAAVVEAAVRADHNGHAAYNVGRVNAWDLEAATYTQLARAAAHAAGADKLRVPLYVPHGDWRSKLRFPFRDAPYRLDADATRDAFPDLPETTSASRDAAVAAGTPKAVYGAKRLKVDGEAVRAGVDEHVLFAAVRDAYAAYEAATAEGPAPIGDGDAALVKDGDALLGSLIFSGLPFHEDLAPPFVEN